MHSLRGLLRAPLAVFDSVRTSTIMNRMLGDMTKIDEVLSNAIVGLVSMLVQVLSVLTVVGIVSPGVLLLLPIVAPPYYCAAQYYRWSMRDLRRLQSASRAPLINCFSEALDGLPTIRSYGDLAIAMTEREFDNALSSNARAYMASWAANQWITCVLEGIGVLIIGGTAAASAVAQFSGTGARSSGFIGWLLGGGDAGSTGMALSLTFGLPGAMMWLVRNWTSMETELIAVERLSECIHLEPEKCAPGLAWLSAHGAEPPLEEPPPAPRGSRPAALRLCDRTVRGRGPGAAVAPVGRIVFSDVWLRYRPSLPPVLKGLSLEIDAGSKVAIVGRTGAGKSSVFLVLQQLYPLDAGSIAVDDVEVTARAAPWQQRALRSYIAYVPQKPTIFAGTVRSNVLLGLSDAEAGAVTDAEIWSVLDLVSLGQSARKWTGGLHTQLDAHGTNISAGERQLLCLARALLRRARILLIDEGTSTVDRACDATVHKVLLSLRGCTVLSICHNQDFLGHYDRVIVMDQGAVTES